MSIASSRISSITPHSGRFRVRFEFTLSDGRVINRGPVFVLDQVAANTKLDELEPDVLESVQEQDAEDAERNNLSIEDDAGVSTQRQRARQYIKRAMREDNPVIALDKLERFNTFRVGQGWSPVQTKAQLGITDKQYDKIIARYTYLKTNEQTLIDGQIVVNGDTVRAD